MDQQLKLRAQMGKIRFLTTPTDLEGYLGGPTSSGSSRSSGGFPDFQQRLYFRMEELYAEQRHKLGESRFVMPVGLFLLVDKTNGGDVTAQEICDRFHLLNRESHNIIDFYFLGWQWIDSSLRSKGIRFNLESFESCRNSLKQAGIDKFGGNADLILVDAHYYRQDVTLKFRQAIYLNLSGSVANATIPSVGEFLQSLIRATEDVRRTRADAGTKGFVFSISDKLGLATAKKSILQFIFKKWGEIIGAKTLEALAVRRVGPDIRLSDPAFALDSVSKGRALRLDNTKNAAVRVSRRRSSRGKSRSSRA
jgi:hypothetical protein